MSRLVYPEDEGIGNYVMFSQYAHGSGNNVKNTIGIAAPIGYTITDGAGYGDIDLGIIGETGGVDLAKLADGKNTEAKLNAALGDVKDAQFITQSILANNGIGGDISGRLAAQSGTQAGKAFNPNTVVQFNNMNLRIYQFQFVGVPRSQKEWRTIRDIINVFRLSMYPLKREGSILLDYPDKWEFEFSKSDNATIPKSFKCHLTDLAVSYNNFGNAWRKDGAPTDVSVSVTFQEIKALDKGEIGDLSGISVSRGS